MIRHIQFVESLCQIFKMKFLTSFILLGFLGSAIGGGDTKCGSLQANYLVLLQSCEYLLDEYTDIAKSK